MKIRWIFSLPFFILAVTATLSINAAADNDENVYGSEWSVQERPYDIDHTFPLSNRVNKTSSDFHYTLATQKKRYRSTEPLTVRYGARLLSSDSVPAVPDGAVGELFLRTTSGKVLYTENQQLFHRPLQDGTAVFDIIFSLCDLSSFTDSLVISAKVRDNDDSEIETHIFVYRPKE